MRKLALFALAASALTVPTLASAQHAGPRGASGHSFGRAGGNAGVRHHSMSNSAARSHSTAVSRSHSNAVARSHSNAVASGHSRQIVRHGGSNVVVRHGGSNVSVRHGGGRHFRHPGPNFRHHRIQRGGFVHPYWFGPQFHVQNWQLYGFAEPPRDQRWVRHYDDAYLIDRQGRVQDTRYGLDWDEYGERWDSEAGIPSYYGRGEYRPDERDYAWVESQERGYAAGAGHDGYAEGYDERYDDRGYADRGYADRGYAEEGYDERSGGGGGYAYGSAYPPPAAACHPAPPQPCGGYGAGYGYGYYGWGVAYPAIIVETTVVSGGTSYVEEVTEEVVEVRRAQRPRRAHRPPPRQRPRPPAGERG
ncbi:RcnB family protein [Sphingosinicella terrae]|uniref:RcnB family protein n=1 Tax=Sphingosinicella terrae TaxID=2172047 RepID=UPI000E0E0023|nr:RcnB family protein [Sphingosinicella terrae]